MIGQINSFGFVLVFMTVSSPDPSSHVKKEMTDCGGARPRCGRFHDDQNTIASNKEVNVQLRH